MSVAQTPAIKGISKDAERLARSNCRYYPERNEEIKQILRTTRLCAGFEPVTSINRSCTPTNLSHSRGVLSKQDVRDIICYRDKCTPHCCALVLVRITAILRSIINCPFCRVPPFVFTPHQLFTFSVTSFLTDGGSHQTFHLARCGLRARTA